MSVFYIILITYILSIFLNRWLNIILIKKFNEDKHLSWWFAYLVGTLFMVIGIIVIGLHEQKTKRKQRTGNQTLNRMLNWFFLTE